MIWTINKRDGMHAWRVGHVRCSHPGCSTNFRWFEHLRDDADHIVFTRGFCDEHIRRPKHSRKAALSEVREFGPPGSSASGGSGE